MIEHSGNKQNSIQKSLNVCTLLRLSNAIANNKIEITSINFLMFYLTDSITD